MPERQKKKEEKKYINLNEQIPIKRKKLLDETDDEEEKPEIFFKED
jgi:hypothetical protein